NPASKHAGLLDLGVISLQTCLHYATSTHSYIAKILQDRKEEPTAKIMYLKECLVLYSDAIGKVQEAIANFKIQAYEGAILDMTDAKTDVYTCEDGFTEGHSKLVSPLKKQAGYFRGLSHISLVITDMVI
ncbi:hypothetical protein MKW92_046003, partial [Papaver armeniacum]